MFELKEINCDNIKKMFNPSVVPKDVWNIIAHDLVIKDLLSLRAVNRRLNEIIIQMQARWYRAQQWLVSKIETRKVKSAIRVHNHSLSSRCIPTDYEFDGRAAMGFPKGHVYGWQQRQRLDAVFVKLIEDGQFPEEKCFNKYHWVIRIPKSELDIPLDKHFKPKQNNYIYHYLIQCYRLNGPTHRAQIGRLTDNIRNTKRYIEHANRTIEKGKINLLLWEKDLATRQQQYKDNDIFGGYNINGYKTPAQLKRAKLEAEKKSKESEKLEAEKQCKAVTTKRKTKKPKGNK
jgi:hypothetical protein